MSASSAEYIITLHEGVESKYRNYLIKRIEETGLSVEFVSHDNTFEFLKIYTSKEWLINYLSTEEHLEEYLAINTKGNKAQDSIAKKLELFSKLPKSAILPSALLCHIIHTTLTSIPIDNELIELLNNEKKEKNEKKTLHLMDKLMIIYKNIEIIDDIFPMNDMHVEITDENRMQKWNLFFNVSAYLSQIDHTNNLNKIRDYYGEEMAFYFAFMEHYTKWLFIPATCGLLFYVTRSEGFDIDESKYMPFFALFVCIWSHFMVKGWNRRASDLAFDWNTIDFSKEKYLIQSDIRPEFRGIIVISPITGKPERYYASYKRYPKFIFGIFLTLFLLTLVFIMMICSLNLQGYIHSQNSIIYIETFDALSKQGALFDAKSNIMWIIPTLIHCSFVFFLNVQYSKVAYKLTEWENWKFECDFENSLILKRFLFEFLDAFLPLFYICFYEMKMEILTNELFSLFLCDEIRRILTESVLPLIMHLWQLKSIEKNEKNTHNHNYKNEAHNVLIESRLEKYNLFDDYLEMITQFGYITLFASCYPLAAVLSLISNIFEVWSDSFKLCFLSQRPIVERAYNIHLTWVTILQFMAWFSILTNCYIFAFSSEQMEEWFPSLFNPDPIQPIKTGHGRYVVLIMFGLEHIIAFICMLIHYMVPNITNNVNIKMQKKQHELYHQYIENIKRKRNVLHKNVGKTPIKQAEQ